MSCGGSWWIKLNDIHVDCSKQSDEPWIVCRRLMALFDVPNRTTPVLLDETQEEFDED